MQRYVIFFHLKKTGLREKVTYKSSVFSGFLLKKKIVSLIFLNIEAADLV